MTKEGEGGAKGLAVGVCGHTFHMACIRSWARVCVLERRTMRCPLDNRTWRAVEAPSVQARAILS
jgi:hypothetical protein